MHLSKPISQHLFALSLALSTASAIVPGTQRHFNLANDGIWAGTAWRDHRCGGYFLPLSHIVQAAQDTEWHNTLVGPRWTAEEHIDWLGEKVIKYHLQPEGDKVKLDHIYMFAKGKDIKISGIECMPR